MKHDHEASVFLSYGLVLIALTSVTVVVLAGRPRLLPLLFTGLGFAVVVAAFTINGFWWLDGYHLVQQRYYQGLASQRPYAYWVWANLAALIACAGPACAPILRRAVVSAASVLRPSISHRPPISHRPSTSRVAIWLALAGLAAILLADMSGLSKAETERIWLPFAVWLPAAAVLLPTADRRKWLAFQALTALLINHLLLTSW